MLRDMMESILKNSDTVLGVEWKAAQIAANFFWSRRTAAEGWSSTRSFPV